LAAYTAARSRRRRLGGRDGRRGRCLITVGVAGEIDTNTISAPVIGFVFGEQGLMANLGLRGRQDHPDE
jgi:hypothetical protein